MISYPDAARRWTKPVARKLRIQSEWAIYHVINWGNHDLLAKLIVLDVKFDLDWWNSSVFTEALDVDLVLAARLLGTDAPAYQHLAVYAGLARQEEPDAATVRKALTSAKLIIGPNARLPKNSELARALCEFAVGHEVATAADLWRAHEAALRARLGAKDRDALHLLCWLASAAEQKTALESLDRLGWKEWKDPEFAVSYVADLVDTGTIKTPEDPELKAAVQVLPEDGYLSSFRLQLAGEKGATKELIVAAIKSEYRKLSVGMIMPDSYRLKALFYELGRKL